MPELTTKQTKDLTKVEDRVAKKRVEWLSAYEAQRATNKTVILSAGSPLGLLWAELEALRKQRNDLLAQFRAGGVKI